jgi:hypothetical protein
MRGSGVGSRAAPIQGLGQARERPYAKNGGQHAYNHKHNQTHHPQDYCLLRSFAIRIQAPLEAYVATDHCTQNDGDQGRDRRQATECARDGKTPEQTHAQRYDPQYK